MTEFDPWQHLRARACPVCGSSAPATARFAERRGTLRASSYASRKTPERIHLRMVVCPVCDLLYAPAAPPAQFLAQAYERADYGSDGEARHAAASYARAIAARLEGLPRPLRALEIGTGNGALLELLSALGFEEVLGFEPSAAAAACASPEVRSRIRVEPFDASRAAAVLPPGHFSIVIANQTLEHVESPATLLAAARALLAPGGALMGVSHDYRHLLMRLLGARAPIIDLEHLQVFSRASLGRALRTAGFERITLGPFANRYPVHYWMRLAPLPAGLHACLQDWLRPQSQTGGLGPWLGRQMLAARVGNLLAWAHRPQF